MKLRWLPMFVVLLTAVGAMAQPAIPQYPLLSVEKTDSADPVLPNQNYDYVIHVANFGTATATNVILHDQMPSSMTFVSASSVFGTVTQATTNVYFFIPTLGEGQEATVTVNVHGTSSGLITNRVFASADNFTNAETDAETTYVLSDLRVTVADSSDPVKRGAMFYYTVVFSNASASAMTNVVATNQLAGEVDLVEAAVSAGSISETNSQLIFALGDIPSGGSVTATVLVTSVHSGIATNWVTAQGYVSNVLIQGLAVTTTRLLGTPSDLNGAGFGDLLLQSKTGSVLYIQAMDGIQSDGGTYPLGNQGIRPWQFAATVDINGDGTPEILARDGGVHVFGYLTNGVVAGVFNLFKVEVDLSPWFVVAGGDFDGDGFGDLLFQRGDSGIYAVVLQRNNMWTGAQYLTGKMLDISPWRVVAAADVDGNGRADLVLREGNTGIYGVAHVNAWNLESAWYLTGARVDASPWTFCAATDLDGDGFDELIFRDGSLDRYAAAFMDNYYIWSSTILFTDGLDLSAWNVIGPK